MSPFFFEEYFSNLNIRSTKKNNFIYETHILLYPLSLINSITKLNIDAIVC